MAATCTHWPYRARLPYLSLYGHIDQRLVLDGQESVVHRRLPLLGHAQETQVTVHVLAEERRERAHEPDEHVHHVVERVQRVRPVRQRCVTLKL